MKKIIVGMLTAAALLGGAGLVAAETKGNGIFNFEDMQPNIEQMHPDWTTKEQEAMFNGCHGEDGLMQNTNSTGRMMNNF